MKRFISIIIGLFIFWANLTYASPALKPEQVFQFSTYLGPKNQLILDWKIAPGYYLYRDKIKIKITSPTQNKIQKIEFPLAKTKKDGLTHDTYQVYFNSLKVPVTFTSTNSGVMNLNIRYQGCSAQGFCYPPMRKDIRLNLSSNANPSSVLITSEMISDHNKQEEVQSIFNGSSYFVIVLSFLGLGLLLAFTPCVLPMIPILSSIIVGHGKQLNTSKAFFLSLLYVIGMAITYAIAGIIVAMIGSSIQVLFQQTWIIVLFSGLFVLLAFSLFGYFELQLPSRWQRGVSAISDRQKSGTYVGVFAMGALSSLIVSPCVSAPLVGVLAYIAQTGNTVLGGVALLALGFGMGIPLLVIGSSAGKLLPKAGPWMESIKKIFGLILLAVAIWMLARVIPGSFTLFLWATLAMISAVFMGAFVRAKTKSQRFIRTGGIVLFVYGIILMTGAMMGNSDPSHPWEKAHIISSSRSFEVVKNMQQLDDELAAARKAHKRVMLDFYADWCTSCVGMDHSVFNQLQVPLTKFVLLRSDLTKNNDFDQAMLKRFHVVAPPTIIFFDSNGNELDEERIVGEVNAAELTQHMEKIAQGM